MKKMYGLAVLALLATSCTKDESNGVTPEQPVNADVICVSQTVEGVTASKAVVENGSIVTASVLMRDGDATDWSGFQVVEDNVIATKAAGDVTTRATVSTATFKVGEDKAISFNPYLYYDKNSTSTNVHLAAVAPAGTVSGTTVTMATTDGQQDVMYAAVTSVGTQASHDGPYSLTFEHQTTQLKFAIKLAEAITTGKAWEGKTVALKSITIQNAQLPASVSVVDGTTTWTNAADLLIPNISNVGVSATTALIVGNPVMVNASGEVRLNIVISVGGEDKAYNNIVVADTQTNSGNLSTQLKQSHLITLTLTEPDKASEGEEVISTKATVTSWTVGNTGGVDLK